MLELTRALHQLLGHLILATFFLVTSSRHIGHEVACSMVKTKPILIIVGFIGRGPRAISVEMQSTIDLESLKIQVARGTNNI